MPRRNFFIKKIIKKKQKQKEIVNVNNDKENFNEEINLQKNKYDDSIDFDAIN